MPLPLNAPLNPFTAFLAAVFKSDGRFLTPFIMPVTMFLPSENQLNAVNTLTIAVIIFGKLAINNGIARTKPIAKFVMIVTPVARIFGALSLIIPAKFVMIVGTYAISTGIELINPCARFWISVKPASIKVPALLLNHSVNCRRSGSACAKNCGIPVTKPWLRSTISCVPMFTKSVSNVELESVDAAVLNTVPRVVVICGISVCILLNASLRAVGNVEVRVVPIVEPSVPSVETAPGIISASKSGIPVITSGKAICIASAMPVNASSTRGTILSFRFPRDSNILLINSPKS